MRSGSGKFSALRDLGLRPKLGILMAVLGLPILVLLVLQYQASNKEVAIASDEADGLTYIGEGPMQLLYDVQRHRLLTAAVLQGETSYQPALDESTANIETDFQRILTLQSRFHDWNTNALVQETITRWEDLKAISNSYPDAILTAHNLLIEQGVIPLVFQVANQSSLYRDPEINTLNTIIGTVSDLARASEGTSRSAAYTISIDRAGAPGVDLNREQASAQVQAAETARNSMQRWVDEAMTFDGKFKTSLEPLVQTSNVESGKVAGKTYIALLGNARNIPTTDIISFAASSIDANEALFNGAAATVQNELGTRSDDARTGQLLLLAFSAFAFAVAIAVALAVAASITRPIERLAYVADQMSLGQLDVEIDVESKNEIGQLAESLRRMQASLKGAIERLRARKAA